MKKKIKGKRTIFSSKNEMNVLLRKIDELNEMLMKGNLVAIGELIGNRKQLFWRNFVSGIAKGIGIGIGVTVITAVIIILLQKVVTLNLPIIGQYIADIVEIVQKSR